MSFVTALPAMLASAAGELHSIGSAGPRGIRRRQPRRPGWFPLLLTRCRRSPRRTSPHTPACTRR
jgi:hypothetical protein